jgi:hypothetical protein
MRTSFLGFAIAVSLMVPSAFAQSESQSEMGEEIPAEEASSLPPPEAESFESALLLPAPEPASPPQETAPAAPVEAYQVPEATTKPTLPSRDMSRDFWQVYLGIRANWIPNEGYDPFCENNVLTQASLGASRSLVLTPEFSFAPGIMWDFGSPTSDARGAQSELGTHRLGVVLEGRFHVDRDVYLLAKLVPQAVHTRAYLNDASFPDELRQKTWRFGLDTVAGAAWNAPRTLGARDSMVQFWLLGEVGYGWTASKDLVLKADVDKDDPKARTRLDLGPLALRGMMMRISAAITF